MPTITASAGRFLVCSVMRALEPCTISTSCPSPAPTASIATIARPVLPSDAGSLVRSSYLTLRGSTTNSFWPFRVLSFCVATTWPVTRARNIGISVFGADARSAHLRYVAVRARDNVDADDLADPAAGLGAGVDRGADGGDVALERDRDQPATDLVLLDERHVRRLQRRVARLDGGD